MFRAQFERSNSPSRLHSIERRLQQFERPHAPKWDNGGTESKLALLQERLHSHDLSLKKKLRLLRDEILRAEGRTKEEKGLSE